MGVLKAKTSLQDIAKKRLEEGHGLYVHKMSYSGMTKAEDVADAIETIELAGWLMVAQVANEAILMLTFRPCNCGQEHDNG